MSMPAEIASAMLGGCESGGEGAGVGIVGKEVVRGRRAVPRRRRLVVSCIFWREGIGCWRVGELDGGFGWMIGEKCMGDGLVNFGGWKWNGWAH